MSEQKNRSSTISFQAWIGILVVLTIPIIGVIKAFTMMNDTTIHPTLSNYAKAFLTILAIGFAAGILFRLLAKF